MDGSKWQLEDLIFPCGDVLPADPCDVAIVSRRVKQVHHFPTQVRYHLPHPDDEMGTDLESEGSKDFTV
nr:unnamed protein product [Digitaria exilis]